MEKDLSDSFVIFRLPHSDEIRMVKGICSQGLIPLSELSGNAFVVSPFNQGELVYAIPFRQTEPYSGMDHTEFHCSDHVYPDTDKEHYLQLVQNAIEQMQSGVFQKLVLANTYSKPIHTFQPEHFFHQIEKAYPSAFVYFISTPQLGCWFGASPEPLLRGNADQYSTVALAGTHAGLEDFFWGDKEKEEQKMVEDFIEQALIQNEMPYIKTGPENYVSGKLVHLKTSFSFQAHDPAHPVYAFLKNINPTPAVGGLPKASAISFIEKNEGFQRNLYAGFIGIKAENTLDLFVNLRCMEWQNKKITLIAGAGITRFSEPENEWIETRNKMKTLGNFID